MNYPILTLLGISAASAACSRTNPIMAERPNIIFIMSDDHAWQAISAYGGPLKDCAPTPQIDRIAKQGMRFDRCLVTNSICGPSRATILTGKYSHLNGFLANEGIPFDGNQQTFPKLLQKAGYQTAIIGKWHLGSTPTGFDYYDILPGQGHYYNPDFIDSTGQHRQNGYVTEIITQKAIEWLKKASNAGKPFMLMMHHKAPHREWQPGPNEMGMYNTVKFPEPPTLFDDYAHRGTAEKSQDMTIAKTMRLEEDLKLFRDHVRMNKTGLERLSPEQFKVWNDNYDPIISDFYASNLAGDDLVRYKYQRYMQDYLTCIAAVDKSVGRILDFLKENGLDKNTLVVYTSDQGFYLGEHGWFDKRWMFEESLRTPLLMMWHGVIEPGSINNDMVSNLDFAETFLEVSGMEIPKDMQGKSLLPIMRGKTPADWRKSHYYHYYEYPGWHSVKRHYGITTARYKLIHFYYDIDEWELFDLQADPREMVNVYLNPEYDSTREDLHRQLDTLMKKYRDSDSLARSYLPVRAMMQE
jgi:arylsulfatase A-like enzyme